MFGTTPEDKAQVEMWIHRVEYNLAQNVFLCFQNTHDYMKDRMQQVPEFGELCREGANEFCGLLDGQLANSQFIAGDHYTMADISAQMALDFGKVVKVRAAEEHTNLRRWHEEVSARPSASA